MAIDQHIITQNIQHIGTQHDPHRGQRVGRTIAKLFECIELHRDEHREKLQDIIGHNVRYQLLRLMQSLQITKE